LTAAENSPLLSVVAYYPYCRDLQPWQAKVPALSLMGAQDEVAPPEVCQRVFAQLPSGTALQAHVYPEARHGFDISDLPPYAKFGSETVGYNAAADAAAARNTPSPVDGGGTLSSAFVVGAGTGAGALGET